MRFAGSNISFDPQGLKSAGAGTGSAAAAGIVDVTKSFGAQREKAPRFDELSATAMNNQSREKQQAMQSEANTVSAGISSFGQAYGQKLMGDATIASAKIQADAQKQSSMMGAIGSIGSAALGLFSDETTKTNIEQIDSALEKLRNLKPVSFYYKKEYGDPSRKHHGFIAQEYKQVLPDATYEDEKTGKLCIDPIDVIALLVRANQELEARITRLEVQSVLEAV
jgi:hypothetical protein